MEERLVIVIENAMTIAINYIEHSELKAETAVNTFLQASELELSPNAKQKIIEHLRQY